MKTLSLILILISLTNLSRAQNYEWVSKFGDSGTDEDGRIAIDSNGNIYALSAYVGQLIFGADTLFNPDIEHQKQFLCKLSNSGEPIWATDSIQGWIESMYSKDGNILFGGSNYPGGYVKLGKFNSNGHMVWIDNLPILGEATSIISDQDENAYSAGNYFNNFSQSTYGFIRKNDSVGNEIWSCKYGNGLNFVCTSAVGQDKDGNILSAGVFKYSVTFGDTSGAIPITLLSSGGINDWDVFMVKYSPDGHLLAAYQNETNIPDYPSYYTSPWGKFDDDGNVYFYIVSVGEYVLFKFSQTLQSLWSNIYSGAGNGLEPVFDLAISFDGESLATGSSKINILDTAGTIQHSYDYKGGGCISEFNCENDVIAIDNERNVYLNKLFHGTVTLGDTTLISNQNSLDIYFAKIAIDTMVGIESATNFDQVNIFPNPSSGDFAIESSKDFQQIIIGDGFGQVILTLDPGTLKTNKIHLNNPGLYIVQLISKESTLTKKILVLH